MHTWILWILAVYGLAVVWVQVHMWWQKPRKRTELHYYVYTHNSQGQIEWVFRSLAQLATLEGNSFYFYVIDSGSDDDTLKIVHSLRKRGWQIQLTDHMPQHIQHMENEKQIVIDVRERCFTCELKTNLNQI